MPQKPELVLELLQDPDMRLCPSCGLLSKPMSKRGAVIGAVVLVLVVPLVIVGGTLVFGRDAMHQQSAFLGIGFVVSLGLAWQTGKAAWNSECQRCNQAALVPLSDEERTRRMAEAKQQLDAQHDQ